KRKNIRGEFSKCHTHSGNRTGLNDSKKSPTIEKSDQFPISFTQVNILSARFGKHSRKFAITQSRNQCNKSGQCPNENQPSGTSDITDDVRAYYKNTGANHRSRNDHRAVQKSEFAFHFVVWVFLHMLSF